MNRLTLAALTLSLLGSCAAFAADPLAGTTWRTFDDQTGAPKVIVAFSESANGNGLSGKIIQRLAGSTISQCDQCSGTLHNRPLIGLPLIYHLKPQGSNEYADGEILDPKSGKIYRLKGKLSADGKSLELRGFIGFSLLGRTQVWKREN
ncbi:MAG: hypothetical protein RLY58_1014 [Pseudomonadota bacterium]|jgi:uncharacterized protein (DUF2147 family)